DRLDAVVVLEQCLELLLVAEAGVVAADDDLQSHELLLRSGGRAGHPWGWDARGGRAGRRSGAGSGQVLPELLHEDREGDGAGVAVMSAVASAASRATPAASRIASAALSPVKLFSRVSRKGAAASTMVLSPTFAPPSRWIASIPASTASTTVRDSTPARSSKTPPAAVRAAPQSAPEVPPADSDQASPARTSRVRAPAPASSASCAAVAAPLEP